MGEGELQLRFDDGHQQRYFQDRTSLLKCVLRVAPHSPHPRFEVWGEGEPVQMADGRSVGKSFKLVETLDLRQESVRERIAKEVEALEGRGDGT